MKEAKQYQEQEVGKLSEKVRDLSKTADKVKELAELYNLKKDGSTFVESLTEAIQAPLY